MKNKIRTILAVLLIAMLALTGCSLGRFGKPSVVSLTKDAMANMKKVESFPDKRRYGEYEKGGICSCEYQNGRGHLSRL